VAVGEFCYPGIHTVALQQNLQLVPLSMDVEGILPAAFEEACRRVPLGALYITPTVDNPTTASLSEARRQEIVRIARKHAVSIIEDDPYGVLLEEPPTAIASLGPDITWHIATLSKCLTPALRFGYAAAPSPEQAQELAGTLQAMTMASPLLAGIARRWIQSGILQEMASAIRAENTGRQELAASILWDATIAADPAAPHLWMSLLNRWRAVDLVRQLEHRGVLILASSSFSVTSTSSEAVCISLGAAPDRGVLEAALRSIRSLLSQPHCDTRRALV
jgi:DNA-binding transcriptional MocR family regulator